MPFNELTIFNPTIPTWDCVSLRVHRTSQKISRKDLQKEMNEEFELITVAISLAATAINEKQLSNCHRQTSFQWSHAKHVTSSNSAPRIWEGGKKFFHAVPYNIYEINLALDCFIFALAWGQRCLFRRYNLRLGEHPYKRTVGIFFSSLISTTLASIFSFDLRFIYRLV